MTATLTWVCLPPDCARAAVATSAAHYDPHDFDIDTLFWELIFLALFVVLVPAVESDRRSRQPDDVEWCRDEGRL